MDQLILIGWMRTQTEESQGSLPWWLWKTQATTQHHVSMVVGGNNPRAPGGERRHTRTGSKPCPGSSEQLQKPRGRVKGGM